MLLFIQMRWNVEGRLPLDDVWKLEVQEAQAVSAKQSSSRLVAMCKVAAQRRVIAIVDVDNADDLDRDYMARLPLHEYLELEAVWPLRTFESFVEDCRTGFAPPALPKADASKRE